MKKTTIKQTLTLLAALLLVPLAALHAADQKKQTTTSEPAVSAEKNKSIPLVQNGRINLVTRGLPTILYNNDGDDLSRLSMGIQEIPRPRKVGEISSKELLFDPAKPIQSVEDYLNVRIGPLANSAVKGLSYNTIGKAVWELDRKHITALGEDPLVPVIEWWKHDGRQFFFSIRMNDIHHGFMKEVWNDFRIAHPQFLLKPPTDEEWKTKYLPWLKEKGKCPVTRDKITGLAFDYSHQEVRDHYLDILSEACRRYDLDGVEFDWMRAARYFRDGEVKTELMTEFVKNARAILDKASKRVGHPIRLVHRVPDSKEKALKIGLDVEAWMKLGCVDAVISGVGEIFSADKTEQWVKLAHQNKVPVYGVIERFDWGNRRPNWGTPETLRAAAATLWYKGVDGIYLFNHFIKEEYPQLGQLSNPDKLSRLPKEYFLDWDKSKDKGMMMPDQYGGVGPLPIECKPGVQESATLIIADDPAKVKEVSFELVWQSKGQFELPAVSINGKTIDNMTVKSADDKYVTRVTYTNPKKMLCYGKNEFKINAKSEVTLMSLNVRVVPE